MRELDLPHDGSDRQAVTVSIGVATLTTGEPPLQPFELIARADDALYAAKAEGRDRVIAWVRGKTRRRSASISAPADAAFSRPARRLKRPCLA